MEWIIALLIIVAINNIVGIVALLHTLGKGGRR